LDIPLAPRPSIRNAGFLHIFNQFLFKRIAFSPHIHETGRNKSYIFNTLFLKLVSHGPYTVGWYGNPRQINRIRNLCNSLNNCSSGDLSSFAIYEIHLFVIITGDNIRKHELSSLAYFRESLDQRNRFRMQEVLNYRRICRQVCYFLLGLLSQNN
jgi:hypothetical protein